MTEKKPNRIAFGKSSILISSGAENLDPNSLLDNDEEATEKEPAEVAPEVTQHPVLAILSWGENNNLLGVLESLVVEDDKVTVTFQCLLEVALNLPSIILTHTTVKDLMLTVRQTTGASYDLPLPGYQFNSISIEPTLVKAKVKIVLVSSDI